MAKRVCDICQQPIVKSHTAALQFETNYETGTTHAWHSECRRTKRKEGKP